MFPAFLSCRYRPGSPSRHKCKEIDWRSQDRNASELRTYSRITIPPLVKPICLYVPRTFKCLCCLSRYFRWPAPDIRNRPCSSQASISDELGNEGSSAYSTDSICDLILLALTRFRRFTVAKSSRVNTDPVRVSIPSCQSGLSITVE